MKPAVLLAMALLAAPLLAGAQGVQTPSATLQTVLDAIESQQPAAPHLDVLSAFFTAALESGALTGEQAMLLLDSVGWGKLAEEQAARFAVRALELALAAVITGKADFSTLREELDRAMEYHSLAPLVARHPALSALPGLAASLIERGRGLSSDLLATIEEAVESGVPPGRVFQTLVSLPSASEGALKRALDELVKCAGEHHERAKEHASPRGSEGAEKGKPSGKGEEKSGSVPDRLKSLCGEDGGWPWCRFAQHHRS